ncbi:MAG TPA: hypothetical protein ENH24_01545 [Nitrospirae bacterium]|nr:hypothetical protein [Nitrospirota bacterium]
MQFDTVFFLGVTSIAIMLYCLWLTLSLKNRVPGGVIGSRWNLLTVLVILFTAGYLTVPFFHKLPPEFINLIVGLIFLFGAIYVLITIRLIFSVITVLTE